MVLLINQKNTNTLQLFKVELDSNTKILECNSIDKVITLSSVTYCGVYAIDIYRNLISYYNKDDIKLIISPELIYPFAKEIILILTGMKLVKEWDSKFWDYEDGIYIPKINTMVQHIESMLVYKVIAA